MRELDDRRAAGKPVAPSGVVPIQAVERAAALLSLFSSNETEMSLGEIARRLSMSRATAHRYCVSLRETGLLHHDSVRNVYSLGPRIIQLGTAASNGLGILRIAAPYLERLVSLTNETAVMSIWDGSAPVVVRVHEATDRVVSLSVRVGTQLPLLSSAQGKVYLAFSPDAKRVHGVESELKRLEPELRRIRQSGTAGHAGVIPGVGVVAAPVFQGQEVAGTLALVGTAAAVPEAPDSALADKLRGVAAELSGALGHTGGAVDGRAETDVVS